MSEIVVEIKMEDGSFRKAYAKLQEDSTTEGKKTGDNFSEGFSHGLKDALKTVTELAAAYIGIRAIAENLKGGIQDAMATDDAFRQLNLTLAQQGKYSEEAAKRNREFTESLEQSTGVQVQTIASGQSLLASLGKLSGEGLEKATKAALDLSAGLHEGPEAGFRVLAMAAQGHVTQLQRVGLNFIQTGDKARDFATVLSLIEGRMGGLAEGNMQTFSGAITKLHNAWDDFWKAIGESITHSEILRAVIAAMSSMFSTMTKEFEKLGQAGNVIDNLILKTLNFADAWSNYVLPPINLAANILKMVFEGVVLMMDQVINDIGRFASLIVDGLSKVVPGLQNVKEGLDTFAQSSTDVVKEQEKAFTESWDNLGNFDWTQHAQTNIQSWKAMAKEIVATHSAATKEVIHNQEAMATPGLWDMFTAEWKKAAGTVQQHVATMARTIQTGLVNGVANGFAAIGKALVTGENLFAAFGKAVLASFGQVLIQLGTQTLAVGLLMSNVPFLFGLQGAAAVAAGIGMIIAGGALTAVASGGGGAPGSAGDAGGAATPTGLGSGGGIAVSPVGSALTDTTQTQNQGPSLTVQIQGHVLDRQSTGLAIADILRENFDLHGITFAGGAAT